MATLDIFNNDAFSVSGLSQTITDIPRVPTTLGSSGLFQEYGIATTTMMIERTGSALKLVPTAPRGGVGQTTGRNKRKLVPIAAVHLPQRDVIMADEVQNVRAVGSEAEVEGVVTLVRRQMTRMKENLDLTLEHMRVGALKGKVLDADGSELWDLHEILGVQQTTQGFALATASTDIKKKVRDLKRLIQAKLGGRAMRGIRVECSEAFFDSFTDHANMKKAWELWQNGQYNREDQSEGVFSYLGVDWRVYSGGTDKGDFIDPGTAYAYPLGIPSLFQTAFAPADYMETVNTSGAPYYAKQERMKFDKGVELESQSNPIMLCSLPETVVKLSA